LLEILAFLLPATTPFRLGVDMERVASSASRAELEASGLYIQNIASLLIATATYPNAIQIQQYEVCYSHCNIADKLPFQYQRPTKVLMLNHLLSLALIFGFYF
jgi:hypothetical protein